MLGKEKEQPFDGSLLEGGMDVIGWFFDDIPHKVGYRVSLSGRVAQDAFSHAL
jgi:hypothetical protein